MIDNQQYRLDFAKKKIPRVETINFDQQKDVRALPACLPACPALQRRPGMQAAVVGPRCV